MLIKGLVLEIKMLKEKLRQKKVTIGSWITLGHPSIAEILALAGNFHYRSQAAFQALDDHTTSHCKSAVSFYAGDWVREGRHAVFGIK
jgi:2-keto-3-deoxy-L-rhamnonate aldolase RhmA